MQIKFINEDGFIFGVSQNVEYKGRFHEELLFGEIYHRPATNKFILRFESAWNTEYPFDDVDSAKEYLLSNHYKFNPTSTKGSYSLINEEE